MTTIGDGFNGVNPAGAPPPKGDPETVLRNYMKEHNCDEATAKAALEQMYGKPSQPMNSAFVPSDGAIIPQATLRQPLFNINPDGGVHYPMTHKVSYNTADIENATPAQLAAFVRYGMEQTGLSEREFAQMVGLPDKQQPDDSKATQVLRDLGIPDDVIAKGDNSIRRYARKHDIQLPPKEKK